MKALLLLLVAGLAASEFVDYSGYQVWRLNPTNNEQLLYLASLSQNDLELDFWQPPRALGLPVDVMVPPMRQTQLHYDFAEQGLIREMYMADVGRHDREMRAGRAARRADRKARDLRAFSFEDYNTYDDIMAQLPLIAADCAAERHLCDVQILGQSFEGRDIEVFRITDAGEGFHDENVTIIDSGIHAREWLGVATNLKLLERLVYAHDSETQQAFGDWEWYIIPVVNPDGYVESWVGDRYWRKNRHQYGNCGALRDWGVDLNRNFPFHFDDGGASDDQCAQDYHGPSGGSEFETQVIMAETLQEERWLSAYISIHCYGNYWLCPYGYQELGRCAHSPHENLQVACCNVVADAIEAVYNTQWTRGPICTEIYPASGGTIDSTYGINGVIYSFTPELRGDPFGFDPPPSYIQPSFNEFWAGLMEMGHFIGANPPV